MNKFVIMAALVAATAGLAVPGMAQEATGIDPYKPPIPAAKANDGDSASSADSTVDNSSVNTSASAQATTINVGSGNPVVAQTETSKSRPVYNTYNKKVVVSRPTRTIRMTRVINGRTRVVHLYKPVDQAQAQHAVIAAMHKLGIVDKAQLNTVLAKIVNDKVFTALYDNWGIASKSFVNARITKAIDPLRTLMLVIALLVAAVFFCVSMAQGD